MMANVMSSNDGQYFPQFKLKVIFKVDGRISSFFRVKDVIPVEWRSHVVYELSCDARVQRFIIYTSRSTRPMAGLRAMNYMQ